MRLLLLTLGLFLLRPNEIESFPYYHHRPAQQKFFLPGVHFNTGIDPRSGKPERGNIGFGNNLAAFFYVCHTCNRAG
uniref:Secreted protein n=1 Tax=Globodera pallida TaxID=36090 RepID=A0A183CFJ0_GLOPA